MLSKFRNLPPGPGPLFRGPVLILMVLLAGPRVLAAQDPPTAPARVAAVDTSLTTGASYWGRIPARADSVAAVFGEKPRPAWETAAMVPYWIIGLPFRATYLVVDQTVTGLDKLGLFGEAAEFAGLKGPWGSYLMPVASLHGQEGLTLGVNLTRPYFLGRQNLLFLRGNRSTKRAGAYAGGALFQLSDRWQLEMGGGFESINQARYYGVGPASRAEDLSYYYRSTSWGGLDLHRKLSRSLQSDLRVYFSRVDAHEALFNDEQSLEQVHADDFPNAYPGESNGWTVRWGVNRTTVQEDGRPHGGGFQGVGISLFQATDGSEVRYLTWHANLEKFFSLWHTDRTLAVRGFANRNTDIGDGGVPFARLVTFKRPDQLRGFSSLRYYGSGSLGVSVEYRWPLWVVRGRRDLGVDGYLFSDAGQVFDRTAEIGLHNFEWTGGGGLRLVNAGEDLSARFELGWSDESLVVRLTFNQTFQYNPKGFLYGKNPTKVR